ncbi:hypothetical protein LEP1GSC170_2316, partial [Leptospira interrogans serovar Bataviae str. HAI135]
ATQLRLENAINSQFLRVTKNKTTGDVQDVTLNDSRGLIHEAVIWMNIPILSSRITLGQINVPFNREYIQSSANFISLERSIVTNMLPQFDTGAMIAIHPLEAIDKNILDIYPFTVLSVMVTVVVVTTVTVEDRTIRLRVKTFPNCLLQFIMEGFNTTYLAD